MGGGQPAHRTSTGSPPLEPPHAREAHAESGTARASTDAITSNQAMDRRRAMAETDQRVICTFGKRRRKTDL